MGQVKVDLQFSNVSELRRWLERKSDDSESPEAYDEWLQSFFDDGNSVSVCGNEYDYWACWELL